MGIPPSQVIANWLLSDMRSRDWSSIHECLTSILTVRLPNVSATEVSDTIELQLQHILRHLVTKYDMSYQDGAVFSHEIDDNDPPYIRFVGEDVDNLLSKLKKIDPFDFESVCGNLLETLGCQSEITQRSNDGGIDFVAHGLDILPDDMGCPSHCKASVIGQAKRYNNQQISEKMLREFVGASTLKRHLLRLDNKLSALTPVLLAFWTTSDFDPNARTYARRTGIWLMDGDTISTYIRRRGLEATVLSMPDEKVD